MMHTSPEAASGETIINDTVDEKMKQGEVSSTALAAAVEERAKNDSPEMAARVAGYVDALRKVKHHEVVKKLPPRVGGRWNGSTVALGDVIVKTRKGGLARTILEIKKTKDHENLHADGHHEKPLTLGKYAHKGIAVRIGTVNFQTTEEVFEAFVVGKTDRKGEVVSREYVGHMNKLDHALATAQGVTMHDVERVLNHTKNLRELEED